MKISSIIDENERRVAITPSVVEKYLALGFAVVLPKNFGISAGFQDAEYIAAGAVVEKTDFIANADIYVSVKPSSAFFQKLQNPNPDLKNEVKKTAKAVPGRSKKVEVGIPAGAQFIGILNPLVNCTALKLLSDRGVHCHALELVPRIGRAQPMDVLSSQASIAGYRAVLEALVFYNRVVPLMMTAAGTARPARVLVLGAGVAGLQAIATARRLGATVFAFDVRAVAREQVESLGATFVSVEGSAEGSGGYAGEMGEDYKCRQKKKLQEVICGMDIVISTAQIPGKSAPVLVDAEMVKSMSAGSVIVDMSTETGGNCELSRMDEVVTSAGVTIIGYSDLAARVAHDSSQFFAKNVLNFVSLMQKDGKIDLTDEIVRSTLLSQFSGV
ncbi:MAG: NAD(P) transhydrogenase subunit alpha [Holosporaceae bacterium]|nr:NAD(P) transhydrogenase subunit alpha [Holosporaceae bacterium]